MEEELEVQEWENRPTHDKGVKGEIPLEEQLNTETSKPTKLNKNGKPRKQLSPEALERLAKAREKANAMRQQQYAKKLEEKVNSIKQTTASSLQEEVITESQNPIAKDLPEEITPAINVDKPKVIKPKGKKKTNIIVEQSSDDSDEFEPNDNVVFVKRVSRKKKELPVVEPVKEPQLQMELPPPEPPRPPRPELTPQQRILKSQYEGMFGGGFINQNNLMRRHY
jgi:hypothetical protein